jgi:bile acid:Na+ symporter, BASS family
VRFIGEVLFTLFWAISFSMTLLFVAARMFHVGLGATSNAVWALLRDRAFLVRALIANVIVVPALGMVIATLLPLPRDAAIAVLLVAAVGGGVNFLATRDEADVDSRLAAALVLVLSAVTVVLSPVIRVLLESLGAAGVASLWRLIAVVVLAALAPLAAGVLVRRLASAAADMLVGATGVIAVILFVGAVLTTLLVKTETLRALGARSILAMVLLIVAASSTGWLLGGPLPQRRALLARVTAARNVGLSLLLAIVSFPDTGVAVAVVLYVVVDAVLRLLAMLVGGVSVPSVAMLHRRHRKP